MQRFIVKPYIEAIEKVGGKVIATSETGKSHYKLVVAAHNRTRFFITSNSPSDQRSVKNFIQHVRRWIREIENERV